MKQINETQIQEIEKALLQANVPVQMFIGIQNLFKGLPAVENKEANKPKVTEPVKVE